MLESKQISSNARRFPVHWLILGMALLVLGGAIGYSITREYNRIDALERERLTTQAKVVNANLEHQLVALNSALKSIRDDLPYWKAQKESRTLASRNLQAMSSTMPGIRTLIITDADGTVSASNRKQLIGLNFREREYFWAARQGLRPAMLYISPPFKSVLGVYVMNVTMVVLDTRGAFAGIVTLALDPDFFSVLLNSVLYAPGMRASLIHGDGKIFVEVPDRKDLSGMDLAKPGSRYTLHVKSGQTANLFAAGRAYSTDERMSAWRTIRPASLLMDKPLMVFVNRDMRGIFASWRRGALIQGGLFGVLVLAAVFGLYFYQRRQRKYDRLEAGYTAELCRNRENAERLAEEMAVIAEIGRVISSTLNIEEVYEKFGAEARKLIPFDNVMINLINRKENTLVIAYVSGMDIPDRRQGDRIPFQRSFCEAIARERKGMLLRFDNMQEVIGKFPYLTHVLQAGLVSMMAVPLISRDEVIAAMVFRSKEKDLYNEGLLNLAERIGTQIAGAIANAQLFADIWKAEKELKESEQRYRALSIVDGLTQLYNSRHFYFQLKIELDRSNRYGQPLALLLLDLDDFKAFNDAYGHVEGDQVLWRLGQVVKRCLRETDIAFRYGGEEFTIILPMTTSADGAVTAERIRTEFKKEIFSPDTGHDVHVTVSIGLAQYKPQEEMKAFVHRVDQLMYQGKKNGKDRVCCEP